MGSFELLLPQVLAVGEAQTLWLIFQMRGMRPDPTNRQSARAVQDGTIFWWLQERLLAWSAASHAKLQYSCQSCSRKCVTRLARVPGIDSNVKVYNGMIASQCTSDKNWKRADFRGCTPGCFDYRHRCAQQLARASNFQVTALCRKPKSQTNTLSKGIWRPIATLKGTKHFCVMML